MGIFRDGLSAMHRIGHLVIAAMLLIAMMAHGGSGPVWATAVSKQEATGRAIVFRYMKEFEPNFQRSAHPDRVILVWNYKSPSGMPNRSEREAMDRLENMLDPVIRKRALGTLVLVSTGDNFREWIYYAKSEQAFVAALNEALAGRPRFPIEIHAGPDPQWSTYETFRKGVRE